MTHRIEEHSSNPFDAQLHSPKTVIEVKYGETLRHDAAIGALKASEIINNGTIEFCRSDDGVADAFVEANHISGCGSIVCALPNLTLLVDELNIGGGSVETEESITLESKTDLFLQGGTFSAKKAHFKAVRELKVSADRIDAEVSVCAEKVSFGVAAGELNVAKSEISGDPIWYNRAGNLNINPGATSGEDLYAFATGNITIGTINTTGGDSSHPGRIVIESGCVSITPDSSAPTNNTVQTACVDCDAVRTSLNVVSADEPTGVVIINGNVSGKNLSIRADDVTINGDVLIDADNNTEGGFAQIDFKTDVLVDGDVTVIGTTGKGKLTISGTQTQSTTDQNLSVTGSIDADVLCVTLNTGSTTVNNVDGNTVEIYSGGAVTPAGIIDVSGTGTNAGGSITVVAAGILDLTNAQFVANGGTTGDGGAVSLSSGSGNLTLGSGLISASAGQGSGSNASGGQISVTSAANLTLSADIAINGVGSGSGGRVDLRAAGTLDLSTHSVSAQGGATGDGGAVSLFSGSNYSVDPSQIFVNGGSGSGSNSSGGGLSAESSGNLTLSGSISLNGLGTGAGGAVSLIAGGTLALGSNTISCQGGSTGSGGFVRLSSAANFTFDPTSISVGAGTGSGSDGNGGAVEVEGAANVTLSGNISVDGIGDGAGGRIVLNAAGVLSIGSFTLSADGGDTGDGGFVSLTSNSSLSLASGQVSVSAGQDSASDGTGGTLQVTSTADVTIGSAINLDGKGDGWGGNLLLSAGGTLGIGTYSLSANGGDTGGGGSVKLLSGSALAIASGQVAASAGTGSGNNADGGTIEVTGANNVTVSGSLSVNGIGTGAGGRIAIDSGTTLSVGSNNFSAQGGTTGAGGFIHLGSAANLTLAASQVSVTAGSGSGSNAAGGTVELTSTANLTLTGTLSANGVGTGAGGSISVNAGQTLDVSSAVLQAEGGSLGNGGAVSITSGADLSFDGSQVSILSGAATGANTTGGFLTIKTTGTHFVDLTGNFNVDGHGSGNGGAIDVDSTSSLSVTFASLRANCVDGLSTSTAGRISLSGYGLYLGFTAALRTSGLTAGVVGGAAGGQIELNHYGTTLGEVNALVLASGSKGGSITIKAIDGPIQFQGTAQANSVDADTAAGSISIDSPESITIGPQSLVGFSLEAGANCTLGAPVIVNQNIVYGNSINVLSGSQLSLDLTNEFRFETLARGTIPRGELKVGSDRNNLPYKLNLKGNSAFKGNPVTVQSAGDLTVSGRHEFHTVSGGLPALVSTGRTYTLSLDSTARILAFDIAAPTLPIDLKVSGERILCQEGAVIGAAGNIEVASDTRLIADLDFVTCAQLQLNAEDVRASARLNQDSTFPVICKVSGESRSGDWSLKAEFGDVTVGDITSAGGVELNCRRGQITTFSNSTVSASNGSVDFIQGTVRRGPLTLSNFDILAHNGDVNVVIDHVPTEAPELAQGTQPSGDITVIPSNGNVYWGQQGITIGGTGNTIEVDPISVANQKAVFYTYNKGASSIILNGNVNLVLTHECLCDLPADIGNIYYGDGTTVVALSPSVDGKVLTTHGAAAPTWGDGEPGPQGPAGPTGLAGPVGSTGPKGPAGVVWKGAWSSATSYAVDDAVSHNGNSYIAIVANTNSQPPSTNWTLVVSKGDTGNVGATGGQGPTGPTGNAGTQGPEGLVWKGSWNGSASYAVDDAVSSNGSAYIAIQANTNSQPPSSSWSLLAQKGGQGTAGATGATGSTGPQGPQGPAGNTGAKGPKGLIWRGAWSSSTSYVVDDAVSHNGTSYIAVNNNNNSQPPSADWQTLSAKGDTGATGSTGAQGAIGATGAQGAQGATGPQGPQGPQGPAGADGGSKSVIKTSDTTRSNTTTLADDPHLSLALDANTTYEFKAVFDVNCSGATPKIKMTFVGPSGSTINWSANVNFNELLSGTGGTSQGSSSINSGDNLVVCTGKIALGSTAGNLTLQWAQNASSSQTTTVKSTGLLMAVKV